ncbi:MAG: ATP-binding protein [Eubacteriales bacterium]|nr:ATP-binding protein [Eubacteriales bacterium]
MKNRPIYMGRLLEFRDKKVIKIVTGIRRCGKSTLLALFAENLRKDGVAEQNIIEMNFESIRHKDITNYLDLYRAISEKIAKEGKTYIILDEIQMVKDWPKAVDSFLVDFDVDIYITGSNAYLMSSAFSTMLSGRFVEIKMLPLSFAEFLDFHSFGENESVEGKFQKYLQFGGMPAIAEYDFHLPRINDVLEGIYSTVVLKDILERNHIGDQALLQKIIAFLADNVGNIVSPGRIGSYLAGEGDIDEGKGRKNPASKTVETYLSHLRDAYVFYEAKRYDLKGKQYLKTLSKYYIVDTGLRNLLLGYRDMDRGHILENIVYFELLRREYRVSIGKIGQLEVDFVAEKPEHKMYIQVTETLAGEETLKRELASLRGIPDNHEKIVLSMDRSFITSYEGIKTINIIDFLLSGDGNHN